MIAISFLGLGQFNKDTGVYSYSKTKYKLDGKIVETPYFPYVVNKLFNPDTTFIIMTEESKKLHSEDLNKLFKFSEVEIKSGKSEDEIWDMFDSISQCVNENDEVILDITNGFRSQPIIAIASLLFLKVLKNIKIKRILYGAFEARENDIVPVFDLKPFIDITEWSYSVNEFLKTGKAGSLSLLMKEIHSNTHINNSEIKAGQLRNKGNQLNEITKSLSVVNIKQAFEVANEFPFKFEVLLKDLENIKSTKPLSLLLRKILNFVEPISLAEKNMFNEKGIYAQFEIIKWYIETDQYQQAITLMNELFISGRCILKGFDPLEREKRVVESELLGSMIKLLKSKESIENKEVIDLWNSLSMVRNEINHAGMNKNKLKTDTQLKNINELFSKLKDYFKTKKLYT